MNVLGEDRTEDTHTCIGLKPFIFYVGDNEPGAAVIQGEGGQRGRRDVDVSNPDASFRDILFFQVHWLFIRTRHTILN